MNTLLNTAVFTAVLAGWSLALLCLFGALRGLYAEVMHRYLPHDSTVPPQEWDMRRKISGSDGLRLNIRQSGFAHIARRYSDNPATGDDRPWQVARTPEPDWFIISRHQREEEQ